MSSVYPKTDIFTEETQRTISRPVLSLYLYSTVYYKSQHAENCGKRETDKST